MELNFLAIFVSLTINLLKRNSAKIASAILAIVPSTNKSDPKLVELTNETKKLVAERDTYNQIDDFAKYSLLNRKINKLAEEIKIIKSEQSKIRMKSLMYIKAGLMALVSVMSIGLIWHCYESPLVQFSFVDENEPSEQVNIFYPINWLLAFPRVKFVNSIGVTFWLFLSNRLIDIFLIKIA